MTMKKLLWLDDTRNPFENDWLVFSPIEQPFETHWLKSYNEFVQWITENGLPDAICFDHDLGEDGIDENKIPMENYSITEKYKTGYDCAKWLVNYYMDNNLQVPKWNIQSSNPVGKDNINGLLTSFLKHINESPMTFGERAHLGTVRLSVQGPVTLEEDREQVRKLKEQSMEKNKKKRLDT